MNRISKRVLAFFLTLVLMLSLCACAQMKQLWAGISIDGETPAGKHNKKPPEKPHPGAEGSDAQPAQAGFSEEAEQSLAWLRDRIDFPQTMFGAAYLGYVEEDSGGDWLSAADQAMLEAYPFLAEIDENHIIGSTGYLYCIVPVDENASVSINRMQWNEKTKTYENTEVCYPSESGEPVLLFANLDGVAYEADTQVWITDNSGNCCEWWPSFDAMSYLAPCTSETGDYLSFDFTEYGWRGVPSEGGFIQADRFKPGQIGNGYHKRGNLTNDCGNGGTLDPHLKGKDKHGVKDHIENGSDDHGEHGILGTAVRPDHGVDGAGNHHEREPNADDPSIVQRIGAQCICGAEQRKDWIDEEQKYGSQDDTDRGHHGHGVADSFFGAVHVAFPQLKAQVGCAAVADHHGQSRSDDGNGKYDVGGTIAQIPHTVADKDLIDDVVQ